MHDKTSLLEFKSQLNSHPCTLLIDSGASANFICANFIKQHNLPTKLTAGSYKITMADGQSYTSNSQCRLKLSVDKYSDNIQFIIVPKLSIGLDVVLGFNWLTQVNPYIDWVNRTVQFKFNNQLHCFKPSVKQIKLNAPIESQQSQFKSKYRKQISPVLSSSLEVHNQISTLSAEQLTAHLLKKFADVFPDDLPCTLPPERQINFSIQLMPDHHPSSVSPYKMNQKDLSDLKSLLDELLKKKFISPSTSSYSAGVLWEDKKDGSRRLCIDYRRLNSITVKKKYAMPEMHCLFEQLKGAKLFTKLDFRSGYWQILVDPASRHYTTMTTRYGNFCWNVMPFGVTDGPTTLMQLLQNLFFDCLDSFLLIYLDDLLIFSPSIEQHFQHVETVLSRLSEQRLLCKMSKCSFFKSNIEFLGHRITENGITPLHDKIQAITQWPTPQTKSDVQQFLGFLNFYRKFISKFSDISNPLTMLTKNEQPFLWGRDQQIAFDTLRTALTSEPVLTLPDMKQKFTLVTDASNIAVAATLLQNDHVISYYSRKLRGSEFNYSTYDKELLALISSLRVFKHFLTATNQFDIVTDNKALTFIQTQPITHLNSRQLRWLEFIQNFSFNIQHRPGKSNQSDPLTRRPDYIEQSIQQIKFQTVQLSNSECSTDLLQQIKDIYQLDPLCQQLIENAESRLEQDVTLRDGILYKNNKQIYIPNVNEIKNIIFHEAHTSRTASHVGVNKTVELIERNYYFPRLNTEVREFISNCVTCQTSKTSTQQPFGLLHPHDVPPAAWHTVSMDFITDLPPTPSPNVKNALFVIVDKLTKLTHIVPINISISAEQTAAVFFHEVVRLHGLPSKIISDRDVRFTSRFWQALFQLTGTKLNFSSSHHPETDGQTERMNRTIEDLLRTQISHNETSWLDHIDAIEIAINNSKQASTLHSPYFLNFGFHPNFNLSIPNAQTNNAAASNIVKTLTDHIEQAKLNLEQAIKHQKDQADSHRKELTFQVDEQVYLSTKHIKMQQYSSTKIKPRFIGPFKITKIISPVAYKLELPNSMSIHPVFHISLLKPAVSVSNDLNSAQDNNDIDQPVPPIVSTDDPLQLYEVEQILKKRCRGNQIQYLVKWLNYPDHENSWEPEQNLTQAQDLIIEWEQNQIQQTQKHRGGNQNRRGRM
jgi:hypothetical protein